MNAKDEISLTRDLLRLDTINPPGDERECAYRIGRLLQDWATPCIFTSTPTSARASSRASAARMRRRPCASGHIDTVPLGAARWSRDPFAGETDGDKL